MKRQEVRDTITDTLARHGRITDRGRRGWECVCGEPLPSNRAQALARHQSAMLMPVIAVREAYVVQRSVDMAEGRHDG